MEEVVKARATLARCLYPPSSAHFPLGEKWIPRETRNVASARRFVRARSPIRVTVSREKELLTVEVHDACVVIPRMRRAGHLETSGRGLAIVQSLAHDWGWILNPYGKSVWFQLLAWP